MIQYTVEETTAYTNSCKARSRYQAYCETGTSVKRARQLFQAMQEAEAIDNALQAKRTE